MNDVLELFNCIVIDKSQFAATVAARLVVDYKHVNIGVVTDFTPNAEQSAALVAFHQPIDITTLFTREERDTASLEHLLVKQVLHYIEVYGLGAPGLFDLEQPGGQIVSMRYVAGISVEALAVLVQNLLYANAPIKDAVQVKRIVEKYNLDFDINRVANNELRVLLYDPDQTFKSGDDAVRWLCYAATGEALLIKSKEVIEAVKKVAIHSNFFVKHEVPLAQVFNRHKALILAAKKSNTKSAINRIARLSKTRHVPIKESIAKTFVRYALTHSSFADSTGTALSNVTLRDKFKFLNLLAQKRVQNDTASFKIRNGKVFTRGERPVYPLEDIERVENMVLESLKVNLSHLKGRTILLDRNVDYGLPVSRKQTVGRLPFGTQVTSRSNEISSGMYWENDWGASDLDLSTIDMEGERVGWGGRGGYDNGNITFSGDLTDARNGAMEFMTSRSEDYGLFVNIYSGKPGSELELVVGENAESKQWIGETLIREKHALASRDSVIGFVKGKTFVVWAGRLGNSRVSGANPIVNESKANLWTVQRLLAYADVKFDVDRDSEIEYNHDLSYSSFSLDKLEALFKNEAA